MDILISTKLPSLVTLGVIDAMWTCSCCRSWWQGIVFIFLAWSCQLQGGGGIFYLFASIFRSCNQFFLFLCASFVFLQVPVVFPAVPSPGPFLLVLLALPQDALPVSVYPNSSRAVSTSMATILSSQFKYFYLDCFLQRVRVARKRYLLDARLSTCLCKISPTLVAIEGCNFISPYYPALLCRIRR